ncbi:hypothetical protein [Winogradskyella sp.]|uniref:hypothetical protein n=1 Tax=Winogradskyella sp. TaxID=1883156 RepID=UPI0025E0CD0D|nr:hypothetical protein [Winogradskyella sp.]
MNNKKNIDRLFQEKFKDFEVAPNDAVWNRINESLPNKKKKRRIIALWWQIGGVAAVIALLLTVGVSVFNSDDNNNQNLPIVNTDKSDAENKQNQDNLNTTTDSKQDELINTSEDTLKLVSSDSQEESNLEEGKSSLHQQKTNSGQLTTPVKSQLNTVVNNSNEKEKTSTSLKFNKLKTITNKENNTKVVSNTKKGNTISEQSKAIKLVPESELNSGIEKTKKDNTTATVDNSTSKKTEAKSTKANNNDDANTNDSAITEDPKKESIQNAIAENTEAIDEKEDKQNRWSISPNVAPVYYSSLGQGSSLDQQFNDNTKSSAINMSYGITGAYVVSKKLKIRAGVNRVNLNQKTSDVFAFTGPEIVSRGGSVEQSTGNITFNNKVQNVLLMSSTMLSTSSAPEAFNTKLAGDVDQRFVFIEVPLELEYRLLDKKFGINVIGGFSTFFLNQNEIYADIDGTSTLIGEANNINDTSFSANFGLGLDYSLTKQWNINLEPQFKYQINTFNNTSGNFRPFFVGVYTGLSFKF